MKIGKSGRIVITLSLWLLYIQWTFFGLGSSWQQIEPINRYFYLYSFPLVFHLNLFVLIPLFLKPLNWLRYCLAALTLIIILHLLRVVILYYYTDISQELTEYTLEHISSDGLFYAIFLGFLFSFAWRFSRDWLIHLGLIEQLNSEKTAMKETVEQVRASLTDQKDHIFVNTGYQHERIDLDELLYIQAEGNYVNYVSKTGKVLVRTGIKNALSDLPNTKFCQIHRSTIVKLSAITKISDRSVVIASQKLPISKSYEAELKQRINQR